MYADPNHGNIKVVGYNPQTGDVSIEIGEGMVDVDGKNIQPTIDTIPRASFDAIRTANKEAQAAQVPSVVPAQEEIVEQEATPEAEPFDENGEVNFNQNENENAKDDQNANEAAGEKASAKAKADTKEEGVLADGTIQEATPQEAGDAQAQQQEAAKGDEAGRKESAQDGGNDGEVREGARGKGDQGGLVQRADQIGDVEDGIKGELAPQAEQGAAEEVAPINEQPNTPDGAVPQSDSKGVAQVDSKKEEKANQGANDKKGEKAQEKKATTKSAAKPVIKLNKKGKPVTQSKRLPPITELSERARALILEFNKLREDTPHLSDVQRAIAEHGIPRTSQESFERFNDKSNITSTLTKAYFASKKKGQKPYPLDSLAIDINETMFNGEERVTVQDIVDFMVQYPAGTADAMHSPQSRALANELAAELGRKVNFRTTKMLAKKFNVKEADVREAAIGEMQKYVDATGNIEWDRLIAALSNDPSLFKNFIRFKEARLQEELSSDIYSEQGLEALMRPVSGLVCQSLIVVSY
jgi:hypothetical protein